MNKCKTIKEITEALVNGADAETLIPYDIDMDLDCYAEMLLLYIKYGKNEDRMNICKEKYKELIV